MTPADEAIRGAIDAARAVLNRVHAEHIENDVLVVLAHAAEEALALRAERKRADEHMLDQIALDHAVLEYLKATPAAKGPRTSASASALAALLARLRAPGRRIPIDEEVVARIERALSTRNQKPEKRARAALVALGFAPPVRRATVDHRAALRRFQQLRDGYAEVVDGQVVEHPPLSEEKARAIVEDEYCIGFDSIVKGARRKGAMYRPRRRFNGARER